MSDPSPARPLDAIILAAGRSTRMGRPKCLLQIGDETFLARSIRVMRAGGCRTVTVVIADDDTTSAALCAELDAGVVVNRDARSEQIDSVRLGMKALPADWEAVAIMPVDCPLVPALSVKTLCERLQTTTRQVLLPMHNGVGGHPVVLLRAFLPKVERAPTNDGLRSIIIDNGHMVEIVDIADGGVLIDIDTPQEYARFIEGQL